jgi:AraC-like DNA-binding protein
MRIAEVYDSALVKQKQRDAAELATIYDTQGKERQIAEQTAGKRLFTTISIAVGILALLILAFAVYIFRQLRVTRMRNRILARQITEALEYKEQLKEQKKIQAAAEVNTIGDELKNSDFGTLSDEQLSLCLRDLIENERLFLQPEFGRQTLIDRTGLSKDRIGTAFAQGSESNSLPAYVRELRLDYAVRLMNEQPDIAVEQVSQASGFTNADTFTRNFRAKYGMTPTAYKQTKINE